MDIETNVDLTSYNTFGLPAVAGRFIRIRSETDVRWIIRHPDWAHLPKIILGGGSNVIMPRHLSALVLKVEIAGKQLVEESSNAWIVEVGAGENWHEVVEWTIGMGWPGLENLALIPGTAGAAPIQNIGAYGVELKDRFDSLDAVDLKTGHSLRVAQSDCRFSYRDSVFKREWAGSYLITRIRLCLPKAWKPVIDYPELQRLAQEVAADDLDARQIFNWVCDARRAKLPDPADLGNVGSFFKNPVIDGEFYRTMMQREPGMVSFAQSDGTYKLSAGWMIEACGWKGKTIGNVGVYNKQALVLINRGEATADEVIALSTAIRNSVRERFGVALEMEPIQL